jgi:bifunctional DNA-binding transcriptional regulator/antitoxin component of YhaV-PrlF toxin-antitoxin module
MLMDQTLEMKRLTAKVEGVSAKIRVLGAAGYERADIARFLGKRYQHVRNVLEAEKAKVGPAANENGDSPVAAKVRVGPDGRIVIPAVLRAALNVGEEDVLFARIEDGELRLSTAARMQRRVNDALREFIPAGVSLVDELIAERRREAGRDAKSAK